MADMMATPSSSQAAVTATSTDEVLMALPKRATLTRILQRHRQKMNAATRGRIPLPPIPVDTSFEIPDEYRDMILYDSGRGNDRIILYCIISYLCMTSVNLC